MPFKSSFSFISVLSRWDWLVFGLCLLGTVLTIVYGQWLRKQAFGSSKIANEEKESFLDAMIMSRRLTLPLFVATLVATWYGGIFGVTQIAFDHGIFNFLTQGVFWYATYLFMAFVLVAKIRRYSAVTLPELTGQIFGPRSAKVSAVFNFFNCVPVAYVVSMGLLFQSLFGGDLLFHMILGTSLVVIYSFAGGFRADVFSDLFQFFIMCSSVALVAFLSYAQFGGWDFLQSRLPATHFEWLGGQSLAETLVWGFIALATLVDPNFYQRCFAAATEKTARRGILISTAVWILFDVCTTAGGLYARAVIPSTESGLAYLTYSLQLLPEGLRGFFLAGIFATIASTLDSFLLIASSSLSYDLAPKKWKYSKFHRHVSLMLVSLISIGIASCFSGDIKHIWKTLGTYAAACLLLPMMVGFFFPKKISDLQFCLATVMGAIAVTYWRFSELANFYGSVDELYIGIVATGLVLALTGLWRISI